MKLYLASRFETGKLYYPDVHPRLVTIGYDVVSTWYIDQETKSDEVLTQEQRRLPADRDLSQLDAADTFVLLNLLNDYRDDRTCGRHHEMGYTIARRRRSQVDMPKIILIGEARSVFHAYADIVIPVMTSRVNTPWLVTKIHESIKTLYASYPPCYR